MNELTHYGVYKKKLQGICDENELVFSFKKDAYPITMTVKPTGGADGQMSMMDEDNGVFNPDAELTFSYGEDGLTWKTSETFTISETLFNKLKNHFKNMASCWLQYFFRNVMESGRSVQLPQDPEDGVESDEDDELECDPIDYAQPF